MFTPIHTYFIIFTVKKTVVLILYIDLCINHFISFGVLKFNSCKMERKR